MQSEHNGELCLITGAAGFVGSHLAQRLLEMGFSVIGVDNFFSGRAANMISFRDHPEFTFRRADIREPDLLKRLKASHPGVCRCFHLAAVVSVPYSVAHPELTMEINHRASLRLMEEADRLEFKSFIFAGSAAEYGDDQRIPLHEDYASEATRHLSPYGLSKFLTSRAIANFPRGVSLRFFNIYGPRQDPASPYSGVISRFIDMAGKGSPLTIFGDGFQTRDFIYVSDVVDAYIAAAGLGNEGRKQKAIQGVFNVGTGGSTTVRELATTIIEVCGSRSAIDCLPERPGDIRHSLAAVGKFQEAAGWSAKVSLQEGLIETIREMRDCF
ncbi:MAG: NAD-dependent epimerase/dehydratase family protein [Syntrophobacteraceae bacterium]